MRPPPSSIPSQARPVRAGVSGGGAGAGPEPFAVEPGDDHANRTLIDDLLQEQRTLTAVDRFARWHDAGLPATAAVSYRHLLPLASPRPGEQFAFEVNLDTCSGCKACVTACHSLNGLDHVETWRSVGLLVAGTDPLGMARPSRRMPALQRHVTTACHHCADPGCLNGCPVLAYDKHPRTGIVRHLDDQCIGCSYCIMKCPYEVPKYSARLGVVRKCDMCYQRLASDQAPACVESCPNEAIRITVIERAPLVPKYRAAPPTGPAESAGNKFLPGTPDPGITLPTTRYLMKPGAPVTLVAADAGNLIPARGHAPLTWMLVLTQMGAGLALLGSLAAAPGRVLWSAALGVTLLGLAAAVLHLGQPRKAWRSFLGWRRSWLSREIIVLHAFSALLALQVVTGGTTEWGNWRESFGAISKVTTALFGLLGVFCSGMVYHDTMRPFWAGRLTFVKFGLTTLLLGSAGAVILGETWLMGPTFLLLVSKIAFEGMLLRHLESPLSHPLARSAALYVGPLRGWWDARIAMGGLGLVLLALILANHGKLSPTLAWGMFGTCFIGELMERHLFFRAEAACKMPGGMSP